MPIGCAACSPKRVCLSGRLRARSHPPREDWLAVEALTDYDTESKPIWAAQRP
jgi:hypothetical protein